VKVTAVEIKDIELPRMTIARFALAQPVADRDAAIIRRRANSMSLISPPLPSTPQRSGNARR